MVYNTTYLTENKVNGKRYFGVHKTTDLNDGYVGSGTALQHAIKKYGKDNFVVIARCLHDTYELALEMEELVVDSEILNSNEWYNIAHGGNKLTTTEVSRKKNKDPYAESKERLEKLKTNDWETCHNVLAKLFRLYLDDYEKWEQDDNKSAGTRARKYLSDIKQLTHLQRKIIQDIKNEDKW